MGAIISHGRLRHILSFSCNKQRDSAVSAVARLRAGRPGGCGSIARGGGAVDFCLLQSLETDFGAHAASCSVGTGGFFPDGKAARSWRC
jgi:hypothetical protein